MFIGFCRGASFAYPKVVAVASCCTMAASGSAELEPSKSDRRSRFVAEVGGLQGYLCSHKGVVFLDDDEQGKQVLTHIKTLSRVQCPLIGGPWSLHFSVEDDQLGCLVGSEHPPQTLVLED